jgi:PAS domain S-box-containing protein
MAIMTVFILVISIFAFKTDGITSNQTDISQICELSEKFLKQTQQTFAANISRWGNSSLFERSLTAGGKQSIAEFQKAMGVMNIDLLAIVSPDGQLLFKGLLDSKTQTLETPSAEFLSHLKTTDILLTQPIRETFSGLMIIGKTTFQFASQMVESSDKRINGCFVVAGKSLSDDYWKWYSNTFGDTLKILSPGNSLIPDGLVKASNSSSQAILKASGNILTGYKVICDIYNRPVCVLTFDAPIKQNNDVVRMNYSIAALTLVGIIFSGVLLVMIDMIILSPLGRIIKELQANTTSPGQQKQHIQSLTGSDEIKSLDGAIHSLNQKLQLNRRSLRENEEKINMIFNKSPIGIGMFDGDYHLIDGNKSFLDIFGLSTLNDLRGCNLFDLTGMPDQYRNMIINLQNVRFDTDVDCTQIKHRNPEIFAGREHLCLDCQVTILHKQISGSRGFLLQVQDITDRKLVEKELENRVWSITAELCELNEHLIREIAERKQVEEDVQKYQEELEKRVIERTEELAGKNVLPQSFMVS